MCQEVANHNVLQLLYPLCNFLSLHEQKGVLRILPSNTVKQALQESHRFRAGILLQKHVKQETSQLKETLHLLHRGHGRVSRQRVQVCVLSAFTDDGFAGIQEQSRVIQPIELQERVADVVLVVKAFHGGNGLYEEGVIVTADLIGREGEEDAHDGPVHFVFKQGVNVV